MRCSDAVVLLWPVVSGGRKRGKRLAIHAAQVRGNGCKQDTHAGVRTAHSTIAVCTRYIVSSKSDATDVLSFARAPFKLPTPTAVHDSSHPQTSLIPQPVLARQMYKVKCYWHEKELTMSRPANAATASGRCRYDALSTGLRTVVTCCNMHHTGDASGGTHGHTG